ncbi:MAG: hypothetical protein BMS9Abin23_0217 [Thermodesulfobacteriota bacterium]|nr:MAG: hypothetical protein BMS9Abin23_0217 [Thermodesulfobacteriota bacterium]
MCADKNLQKGLDNSSVNKRDILIVLLVAIGFFTYFILTTESDYRYFPRGDARVYTLMTLHFDDPGAVGEKLPLMYSQRLFPPMVGFLLARTELRARQNEVKAIATKDDTQEIEAIPLNRVVLTSWLVSNFIAYLLQLFFLVLIVAYLNGSVAVRFFMLVIYSMWFLSARLYVNWAQMPDPWAFTFLLSAAYFMMKRRSAGFLISILLGIMSKELLLFLVPAYVWRLLSGERTRSTYVTAFVVSLLPAALFIILRAYPYFPSEISTPNVPNATDYSTRLVGRLSDYMVLLTYHYKSRLIIGPRYLLDTLIIPFGVFSGLSFFLAWHVRDTWRVFKRHLYWTPYLVLTALVGLNVDRYIFYIFPVVIIVSTEVLERNYRGKGFYYVMLFIAALTAFTQDIFAFVSEASGVSLKHQLEIAGILRPELARDFRILMGVGAIVAFTGFFVINRVLLARQRVAPRT